MSGKKKPRRRRLSVNSTEGSKPAAVASPLRYEELADLITPDEAGAFLRISRNSTYELLKSGALRSVRFGRLIRIPKSALMGEPRA